MDIEKMIKEMTLEEKAALVSGTDFMYTNPIPQLNIPSLCMADGPHGLRKQTGAQDNGISQSEPATAFPTAVTTASGWNPENARKLGEAIGRECKHYGVDLLLGPGVNIKRNPLCGRNFEYFSEDPLLAGEMGSAEVIGVQSTGVGACVKHFALNNSENYRFMGDSVVDMRAMREIYLRAFETIVKKAKPASIMCAYNKINGTYCSENKWLLTDVLRDEWGFEGAVMTDWGAMHDRVSSLKAGLDLEMPGDTAICRKWILDGVANGTLDERELDAAVRNILSLIARLKTGGASEKADFEAHHILAGEIAEDSAVLLQNDGILPLAKSDRLLVVGDLFEKMRYQGAGSSMIHPTKVTTPKNAFDERKIHYAFCRGYAENQTETGDHLLAEATAKAAEYEKILVFAGLTDYVESEGCDRETMSLPANQLQLIESMIEMGKRVIVVLFGGSVVALPFAEKVSAILHMLLPGQNGGSAAANLIFGDKTPSGKLAEAWPLSYDDVPFGKQFGKGVNEIYKESVFVGYRYYETAKRQVRYPFGYGLSYTRFAYRNMAVCKSGETITVTAEIENTGNYDGAEVVQLYVKAPKTAVFKPEKELRGFAKVYLRKGESKKMQISFEKSDLSYFDIKENRFVLWDGEYELQLACDAKTVKLSAVISLAGEKAPCPYGKHISDIYQNLELEKITDAVFEEMSALAIPPAPAEKPITMESRFTALRASLLGRILFCAVLGVATGQMKRAKKMPEGPEKDNAIKGALFLTKTLESNSLISMSMCAGARFPYNFAQGFMHLANGHIFRGALCFMKKIKVPKLPKDEVLK